MATMHHSQITVKVSLRENHGTLFTSFHNHTLSSSRRNAIYSSNSYLLRCDPANSKIRCSHPGNVPHDFAVSGKLDSPSREALLRSNAPYGLRKLVPFQFQQQFYIKSEDVTPRPVRILYFLHNIERFFDKLLHLGGC